jgi:3-phosphoshikimate 1-carboxyvinyltransferase
MERILITPPQFPPLAAVRAPGSKSYTNRALLTAAMATGTSRLTFSSPSSDSEALVRALRSLGVLITEESASNDGGTTLHIVGCGGKFTPYHGEIDVGPAGTTMRFLCALCAAIPGADIVVRGSERMHARPIGDLVLALRQLGATIDYIGADGCPPLRIHSDTQLKGGAVRVNGSISSQFISALLLTAPLHAEPLTVEIEGEQISKSYIDMTLQSIADFGVTIENHGYQRYSCRAGPGYGSRLYPIEGDASGASYLWAIAALSGGEITVKNINPESAQGDIKFPDLLARMGCSVSRTERSITVKGTHTLRAIDVDMSLMPDTAQTLAVIAACAEGSTTIKGLSTLRVKETDRLAALHTELAKLGIDSEAGPDYLVVHGGTPRGAHIATYDDHRMAMAFAVLGARISGVVIEEPHVVSKSFPDFWEVLKGILGPESVLAMCCSHMTRSVQPPTTS